MPRDGRIGRAPTMRDVAQEAGVSKALVSIVFRGAPGASEESRREVFSAAERLGYRPNRTASLLALRRSRQLGVIVDLHNGFHAEVVDAVLSAADEARYQVVLSPWTPTHSEQAAITTAMELRCEALLLVGPELGPDVLRPLVDDVPVVSIGRALPLDHADVVRSSDAAGMAEVVDHLVGLGHRRIAHIDGGVGSMAGERREGFTARMRHHGLQAETTVVPGGRTEPDGYDAARRLLELPSPPSAVAAFNDHCAVGAMDAYGSVGLRVPGDVSVTGYDDSLLAQLRAVDLTSVRQDAGDLGRRAVTAAVERLDDGRDAPVETVLTPRLVVRSTSGPPGARDAGRA